MQTTNTLLMVRPVCFKKNEQTATNNHYQKDIANLQNEQINTLAQQEFDGFAALLRSKGIEILVIEDTLTPEKPDSIFPNNWVSFHEDGTVVLYPMFAQNRRIERRTDILETLQNDYHFKINQTVDYSYYEQTDQYLEGTGSMVLDRENKIAYAAISDRTDLSLLDMFCEDLGYKSIYFYAFQDPNSDNPQLIYHTNVMMSVADKFAVVCLECVKDDEQRKNLSIALRRTHKKIIEISMDQTNAFAGNMLQVHNRQGQSFLIMSQSALESLDEEQVQAINEFSEIVAANLHVIETCGGGSARCMLAEVFLPRV